VCGLGTEDATAKDVAGMDAPQVVSFEQLWISPNSPPACLDGGGGGDQKFFRATVVCPEASCG
jgi:hypothetical protein